MQTEQVIEKPLQNLGELMPRPDKIPDLSSHTNYFGQTEHNSIVGKTLITQSHKIVFILAKTAKAMHRDNIAIRSEVPLSNLTCLISTLKNSGVIMSPSWGYWNLTKNFLNNFQLKFGAFKTETLLKMFDEAGIDPNAFTDLPEGSIRTHQVVKPSVPDKQNMLDTVKAYLTGQKTRLAEIESEIESDIQRLSEEKQKIVSELSTFGQLVVTGEPAATSN